MTAPPDDLPRDAHHVAAAVASEFPELKSFVQWGFDMQLADAAELLLLPRPELGLHAGQNFTAATGLLNLIAGASVWCFEASVAGLTARNERSRRFRDLVRGYWPWDGEGVDEATGVGVLYTSARNPLAHTSGLPGPGDDPLVRFVKSPLSTAQVAELSAADARPDWLAPAITPTPHATAGTAYDLFVPGLYWSVQRLLRRLLADPHQAAAANVVAADSLRRYAAPNAPWRQAADAGDSGDST